MAGPIIGAAVFLSLPEVLRLPPNVQPVLIGVVLILVVVLLPRGIVGTVEDWWKGRVARRSLVSAADSSPAPGEK
jgi:branched-chain amino acid transport system permease protein